MHTIRFDWSPEPGPANPDELVLTADPLAKEPYAWFEDYFDYPRDFKAIYLVAKQKSTGWTSAKEFQVVRVLDVPYLDAFEHQVHSFWMQVERDTALVNELVDREKPEKIILTATRPGPAAMSACLFDPGLFEYTAAAIAKQRKIPIEHRAARHSPERRAIVHSWPVRILGAISAQIKAPAVPRPAGRAAVFVSPQVWRRIGPLLAGEATKRNLTSVVTETSTRSDAPTTYSIAGRSVSLFARIAAYRNAMAAFNRIPAIAWSAAFTREHINYGPPATAFISHTVKNHLWNECYRLLLLNNAIALHKPATLLVLYDHGLNEACSVQLCKQKQVKTITLQHGIANKDIPGYLPMRSDIFAAWGAAEKQTLIAQGVPAEKIVVTGYPAFDQLWQDRPEDHLPPCPIIVLIATQGVQASVEWRLALTPTARIIAALAAMKIPAGQFQFVIRLHPNEDLPRAVKDMAASAGIIITKGVPLAEQLSQVHVVVTQFSTIGFEALLANKPLVSMNWVGNEELIPFAERGVAVRSQSQGDFFTTINNASKNGQKDSEDVRSFLSAYLAGPGATSKIINIILAKG